MKRRVGRGVGEREVMRHRSMFMSTFSGLGSVAVALVRVSARESLGGVIRDGDSSGSSNNEPGLSSSSLGSSAPNQGVARKWVRGEGEACISGL